MRPAAIPAQKPETSALASDCWLRASIKNVLVNRKIIHQYTRSDNWPVKDESTYLDHPPTVTSVPT